MYDKCLKADLQDFRLSVVDNIYTLEEVYKNIKKVIKNRTSEKIIFLKYLLDSNIICWELYEELRKRVENDFKLAILYILGLETKI